MTTFVIGDTHFGHRDIIRFDDCTARHHFKDIREHDDHLVAAWNEVVGPEDVVWHLGDVAMGKVNLARVAELNGTKNLVRGTHDRHTVTALRNVGFEQVVRHYILEPGLLLYHYPNPDKAKEFGCDRLIHGHSHEKLPYRHTLKVMDGANVVGRVRAVNVSCEWLPNLAPVPVDELWDVYEDQDLVDRMAAEL